MTPFEQKELDELMNLAMSGSDNSEKEKVESSKNNPSEKDKVYREPKKKAANFKFPYQSPVIKKDNIIYNPEFEISDSGKKVIVRSPDNYHKFIVHKE